MFVTTISEVPPPDNKLSPSRIVLMYTIVGIAWILFSDTATAWFVKDLTQFEHIGIMKGIFFIRHYARQLDSSRETFQQAEQEIEKLAYYDSTTDLPNYNLLLDRLSQVIAFNSRKRKNTSVIYISLTGFKAVVDTHGHSCGCNSMRVIADRLVSTVRQYDTVARIHHDEFVVV